MHRFAPIFQWLPFDAGPYLSVFRVYVQDVEGHIEQATSRFNAGVTHVESPLEDGAEYVAHYAGLSEGEWDLAHIFLRHLPTLQRKSAFTTLMGIVEQDLNRLCERVRKVSGFELRASDLSGRGIMRSKDYLKKVARVSVFDDAPEWGQLCRLIELRNHIVHDGSANFSRSHSLASFVAERDDVQIRDGELLLSGQFLMNAVAAVEAYYTRLAGGLRTWCENAGR